MAVVLLREGLVDALPIEGAERWLAVGRVYFRVEIVRNGRSQASDVSCHLADLRGSPETVCLCRYICDRECCKLLDRVGGGLLIQSKRCVLIGIESLDALHVALELDSQRGEDGLEGKFDFRLSDV